MRRQVRLLAAGVLSAAVLLGGCKKEPVSETAPAADEKKSAAAAAPGQKFWDVTVTVEEPVTMGSPGTLVAQVASKSGYKINDEYPTHFRVGTETTGVKFEDERFSFAESAERVPCKEGEKEACQLKARIPFSPLSEGAGRVSGVVALSVCSDDICLIEKVPVDVPVNVRAVK